MEDTEAAKIRYIYQGLKNICESATCASCNLGSLAGKTPPPCIIYKVTLCSFLLTASCTFLFLCVPGPWHFDTDPDPWVRSMECRSGPGSGSALFGNDFQDCNKKLVFFYYFLMEVGATLTSLFKDNMLLIYLLYYKIKKVSKIPKYMRPTMSVLRKFWRIKK